MDRQVGVPLCAILMDGFETEFTLLVELYAISAERGRATTTGGGWSANGCVEKRGTDVVANDRAHCSNDDQPNNRAQLMMAPTTNHTGCSLGGFEIICGREKLALGVAGERAAAGEGVH